MEDIERLECPEEFDFPFTPYNIQKEFMQALYTTISESKYGIFESPTGTGKSLSIICGAIRWLKDHNDHQRKSLSKMAEKYQQEKESLGKDSTDWLNSQSKEIEINEKLRLIKLQSDKIIEYEERMSNLKKSLQNTSKKKYFRSNKSIVYQPDDIGNKENLDGIDDEMLLFDDKEVQDDLDDLEEDKADIFEPVKIYICSRTHSQLSQFVSEIIKSPFGSNVRAVSLASRQVYCINPEVKRLKSMTLINERCLDMQKGSTAETEEGKVLKKQKTKNCKCEYYKPQQIENLRDLALVEIFDVEDLIGVGKQLKACPYYASRKAVKDAEIVLVPYNTLFHKATREANGIKLKNNVIIIDEAHNLLETLAQIHNCEVNLIQLDFALSQLKGYKTRFSTRFSSVNLLNINQLIFVITKLIQLFENQMKNVKEASTDIFTTASFVLVSEIDNYNMFKLTKFAKDAKLSQKIHHYTLKYPHDAKSAKEPVKKGVQSFLSSIENNTHTVDENNELEYIPVNPLLSVISFLQALTYSYEDGRIFIVQNSDRKLCKYQYLVLNSSSLFKDIVDEARSVIVAGGTMKPIAEFRERLFVGAGVERDKILEFSCDHIISQTNILPLVIDTGPLGNKLLFNFENRNGNEMTTEIVLIIYHLCRSVPGGIVVFFPSYQYESLVWEKLVQRRIAREIFREPRNSGSVESVLEKYAAAIREPNSKGALLFSVVGGKLSEGLNFSDDLGRCVVVVGLPYANVNAVDLKEKMLYLDIKEGYGAGQKFYENLCMKAVNQCIGRAVRHKNDYATVLLLDERYSRSSTKNALPNWIKENLKILEFTKAINCINVFFFDKKNKIRKKN
ncbi:hypothetical protein WA026_009468 [Henosepilachna vigintioctopunctata]|uniref:Helicase ATP-binding domain-containing protein n=1 Tax=Henosepilachna vigintioctopunctata TaxID=420089 RepID=A0AAW1U622_9CUCU